MIINHVISAQDNNVNKLSSKRQLEHEDAREVIAV